MNAAQRWLLHLAAILVAVSGVCYGVLRYFGEDLSKIFPALFPTGDDPFRAVQHPLQPWALDLHVLAAPVLVFAIGWIFKDHVLAKLGFSGVPARRSGVLILILILPMVITGYWIQTNTREALRLPLAITHAASGLLFGLSYGLHVLLAPKRSAKNGGGGDGVPSGIRTRDSRLERPVS